MDDLARLVAKKRIHGVAAMLAREENRALHRAVDQLPDPMARIARLRDELEHLLAVAQGAPASLPQQDSELPAEPGTTTSSNPPQIEPESSEDDGAGDHVTHQQPEERGCAWTPCGNTFVLRTARHKYCSDACRNKATWAQRHPNDVAQGQHVPDQAEVAAHG